MFVHGTHRDTFRVSLCSYCFNDANARTGKLCLHLHPAEPKSSKHVCLHSMHKHCLWTFVSWTVIGSTTAWAIRDHGSHLGASKVLSTRLHRKFRLTYVVCSRGNMLGSECPFGRGFLFLAHAILLTRGLCQNCFLMLQSTG